MDKVLLFLVFCFHLNAPPPAVGCSVSMELGCRCPDVISPVQHGAGKVRLQLTAKLLTQSSAAHVLLRAGKLANIPEAQRGNFYCNFPGE